MAAAATLAQSGLANAVTYDMGGTSTDVALIAGGVPEVSAELSIAYGLPIHLPMVDVRTVGAGGGSVAGLDAAGMLRVGPESAGSDPGPICYGRGGSGPTITDANLVLGRLDPARLLAVRDPGAGGTGAGRLPAGDRGAARLSAEQAAEAVIRLANVHMTGAIRMVSLSRGTTRGGSAFCLRRRGPLHAVALAREIGIPEVLVPARARSDQRARLPRRDLRQDLVNTLNRGLDDIPEEEIAATLAAQRERGLATVLADAARWRRRWCCTPRRCSSAGQTHLIRVALPRRDARAEIQAAFEAAYFARFQMRMPEIRAVLVNLNTSVIGRRRPSRCPRCSRARQRRGAGRRDAALCRRRLAPRDGLAARRLPGARIAGPAILQQADATTVLEPGSAAVVDAIGNLRIRVDA
jgi:N-methylhydantoinase A